MTDIRYPSRALNAATDSVSIATVGTSLDVNLHDGAGTAITSQANGSKQALDVGIDVAGVQIDPRSIRALTSADVVTANQGGTWTVLPGNTPNTTPWLATIAQGGNSATVTVGGALVVDGSGSTQPVSGTVTVQQATAANLQATVTGTVTVQQATASNLNANVSGTVTVQQATAANLNATVSQAGTWNINNISGTVSLPTGAALSSKQPALGTAGTASADVITVQGIASMTALKVDGSAVTQPVSIASVPAESGRSKVLLYRNDYGSVNVTTAAYVQVVASTSGAINRLYIADTSGSAMILATGGAGSEVDQLYIGPGGSDAPYELNIPTATRISIKALDVSATSGQMVLTALS